jgi:murein DD-endopeptidase MepM/ murein hydrolase activator NlpD
MAGVFTMKIIIVNDSHSHTRSFTLGGWTRAFLSVCLLGIPAVMGAWCYSLLVTETKGDFFSAPGNSWMGLVFKSDLQKTEEHQDSAAQIAALKSKMAELQARLMRLDALGEKLTFAANLEKGEFDFSGIPALGGASKTGPEVLYATPHSSGFGSAGFVGQIEQLSSLIDSRELQLNVIDALLSERILQEETVVSGVPVDNAWISSLYGYRKDPFTGRKEFHAGIDFAVAKGAKVKAIGSGVVNWSGRHPEYGNLVEIKHNNGLVTRYAHNSSLSVKAGDVVKKGQVIALAGSTGRSTAPHVHLEVYKNGRLVDPATYIRRTNP